LTILERLVEDYQQTFFKGVQETFFQGLWDGSESLQLVPTDQLPIGQDPLPCVLELTVYIQFQ
jgi:hypothetical protein